MPGVELSHIVSAIVLSHHCTHGASRWWSPRGLACSGVIAGVARLATEASRHRADLGGGRPHAGAERHCTPAAAAAAATAAAAAAAGRVVATLLVAVLAQEGKKRRRRKAKQEGAQR